MYIVIKEKTNKIFKVKIEMFRLLPLSSTNFIALSMLHIAYQIYSVTQYASCTSM